MKILVTGSSGFIGSHLIDYLMTQNHDVYGISRKLSNKKYLSNFSLSNKQKLTQYFKKFHFDAVIHLASLVPINHQVEPEKILQNCRNTINLLNCCRKFGITRFVFASGHLVYGTTQYLPIDENHSTSPENNYGLIKLIEENICKMFFNTFRQNIAILRISSVYGFTQPERHIIPTMLKNSIQKKIITVNKFENGFQLMDLIHVNDVCMALELACTSKHPFLICNISSGKGITPFEIAKKISKISKAEIKINQIHSATNHFVYDISLAKKILGFKPKEKITIPFLMEWYKSLIN